MRATRLKGRRERARPVAFYNWIVFDFRKAKDASKAPKKSYAS